MFSKTDSGGSDNHWTLQFDSSSPKHLIIYHPGSGNTWDTGIKLTDIAGAWHKIRIVRSGNTMKAYLDAMTKPSGTLFVGPGSGNGHLNIGVDRTASSGYVYKGLIDDVRIYNCAPPDVNTPLPPDSSLVGYWALDGSSGNMTITAAPLKASVFAWSAAGVAEKWSPAQDAFFRGIGRN
ncbi:MAG: hypothetical protein NTW55_05410 [Planctomycetota bacterium]|nr:hypothetical protein [Planctomycetota bacterium]